MADIVCVSLNSRLESNKEEEEGSSARVTFITLTCRANMAHMRQSRSDSGLGFQKKIIKSFKVFPLRSEAARAMARPVIHP